MIMKATIRSMGKNEKWQRVAANTGMAVDDDEFINFCVSPSTIRLRLYARIWRRN